jgi:hypothetical protein
VTIVKSVDVAEMVELIVGEDDDRRNVRFTVL